MFWAIVGLLFVAKVQFTLGQSSTTSSAVPTQTVNVGAGGLSFTPDTVKANIGDIIEFRFYPQNHSVARSEFGYPCIPYEDTGIGKVGFWSGFHPMPAILSNPPTLRVKVNDTDPIWFYCSAPGACISDGMIGVINPNSTQTLDVQRQFAKNSTLMLSPGEPFPSEVARTSSSSSSATASSTSASTNSAAPSPTPNPATSSSPGLSGGAIAGIAIGGVAVLILAAVLIYLCGRQRTLGEIIQRQQHNSIPPPYNPGSGHMSMTAPPMGYVPKTYMENDPLNMHRYSNQVSSYPHSEAGTESYRSRSPPVDEVREVVIPPMNLGGQQRNYSPAGRNSVGATRPVPQSPGRGGPIPSPLTPMVPHQEERTGTEYPNPSSVGRVKSQTGPHELSVESDRNYIPYHPRTEGL